MRWRWRWDATTALAEFLIHADLSAFTCALTWGNLVRGLLDRGLGTALVFSLVAVLYNKLIRCPWIVRGRRPSHSDATADESSRVSVTSPRPVHARTSVPLQGRKTNFPTVDM